MSEKILFVDDEANILSAIKRQLHKKFEIYTAVGGRAGLEVLESEGPFAIVVSDMRMPEMDGIQFLQEVMAVDSDTVRMMLTGNADQGTAASAINQGNIFSFLSKPCSTEMLEQALSTGLRQYRMIKSERNLLEKTLAGSIKMLVELLAILDPDAFGRSANLRERIRAMAKALKLGRSWTLDMATMLCNIGHVALPPEVVRKIRDKKTLSQEEQEMVERVPQTARNLLANIPRLEEVCEIIYYQRKRYDGGGFPHDDVSGEEIPPASRMLRLLSDLETAEKQLGSTEAALDLLAADHGAYDPVLLEKARSLWVEDDGQARGARTALDVSVKLLEPGDILARDINTGQGVLVLASGHKISQMDIERLRNKQAIVELGEPIKILRTMPTEAASATQLKGIAVGA